MSVATGDYIAKKARVIRIGAAINQGVEGGVGAIGCTKTQAAGEQCTPLRRSGAGASEDIPSTASSRRCEIARNTGVGISIIADIGNSPMPAGESIPTCLEAGESLIAAQSTSAICPCGLREDHAIGRVKEKCRAANPCDIGGGGWPVHSGGRVAGRGNIADR